MKSILITGGAGFIESHVVRLFVNEYPEYKRKLEITDINKIYLERGQLNVGRMSRGTAWLDTGTFKSLMRTGEYVRVIEERQGMKIGCIEEIAHHMGYIDKQQLKDIAKPLEKSGYGSYLLGLVN